MMNSFRRSAVGFQCKMEHSYSFKKRIQQRLSTDSVSFPIKGEDQGEGDEC